MKAFTLVIAAMGAVALLSAGVATVSARNLSSSSQTLRMRFSEVVFQLPFENTNCQVTLEGSLHNRTIAKVVGALVGYITAARLGSCPVGTATVLAETLPWHVRYKGFGGTLPNLSVVRADVVNASFRVRESGGVTCLARTTAAEPIILELSVGSIGQLFAAGLNGAIATGAECFNAGGFIHSSIGSVSVLNSTTLVSIRLI